MNGVRGRTVAAGVTAVVVAFGGGAGALAATHGAHHHKKRHAPASIAACVHLKRGAATSALQYTRAKRCPKGEHRLDWSITGRTGKTGAAGATGPQGPAGATTGVSGDIAPTTPVTFGKGAYTSVVAAHPVTTAGTYFLSAMVALRIDANDSVSCRFANAPNNLIGQVAAAGNSSVASTQTVSLVYETNLAAGQTPSVDCFDTNGGATGYYDASITGTLIDSDADAGTAPHAVHGESGPGLPAAPARTPAATR